MVELEFYDPSGCLEITQHYAARLPSLDGKRIGILSGDQWQAHRTLPMLKALMEADFPGVEVLPIDTFPQGRARRRRRCHPPAGQGERRRRDDHRQRRLRVLLHRARSRGGKARGLNIPTVLFGRTDFLGVVRNAVSGLGFPPEAPVVPFPVDMFLPGSDLSSIEARRQEFYDG
jgi:hypothetical protein